MTKDELEAGVAVYTEEGAQVIGNWDVDSLNQFICEVKNLDPQDQLRLLIICVDYGVSVNC